MSLTQDAAKAFARQAQADFKAWELYIRYPKAVAAECHRLLLLQMACEKLCKAHMLRGGVKLAQVERSHGVVKAHLWQVLRQEVSYRESNPQRFEPLKEKINQLAAEIEVLNPSMDRGRRRKDNCEYPWQAGDRIISPLDYEFTPMRLLADPSRSGPTILKVLKLAIERSAAG